MRQASRQGYAVQGLGPPDCLRALRQTGSVASFEFRPLRFRPHSATASFAQKQAKGLRLRGGLCRANRHQRRMLRALRNRLSVIVGLGILRFRLRRAAASSAVAQPAASWHGALYSLPPLSMASARLGVTCPANGGGRQLNIMQELCATQKSATSATPHNFALCVSCLRFVASLLRIYAPAILVLPGTSSNARPPVRPLRGSRGR